MNKCERFLRALDSQHQNLKFTIEIATQSLCFLDVEVKFLKSGVETLVWRKPSHTGLLSGFIAICPKTWKTDLIMFLLHTAKLICLSAILCNKKC